MSDAMAASPSDLAWRLAGVRNGWKLPKKAARILRLPIVRHVRAAVLRRRVSAHYAAWSLVGGVPAGYDDWVIYAIMRGWV